MLKKLNFYLIYIFLLFCICSVVTDQYENNTQVQEFNKTFDGIDRMQTHQFILSPLFSKYSYLWVAERYGHE